MADFHWHTEDEDDWPVDPPENEMVERQRPSWQFPLIIIVVLGLTAAGLYSLFERRAEEAQEVIKADVLRTHELVMDAAESGDDELFTSFLSGASARWLELQREAVKQGNFNEIPWLGFRLADQPYRLDEISLAPTLDEATVTYTRWYQNNDGAGRFPLQHVALYRRGENRWLLSPPTADFWGDEATTSVEQLTLVYPERDQEEAERLVEYLVESMPEICPSLPGEVCPEDWAMTVTLSSDMEDKLFPTRVEGEFDDLSLDLPTPTLLGRPLDGTGYEAVLESYKARLHRETIASLSQYLTERPEMVPPLIDADSTADLPDAEIAFSCLTGGPGQSQWNVFRYHLANGRWQVTLASGYEGEDSGLVFVLPDGQSYLTQDYLRDDLLTSRLTLWRDFEPFIIQEQTVNFDNALMGTLFPAAFDPTGQFMVLGLSSTEEPDWSLLDLAACGNGRGCDLLPLINTPTWSPDSSQTLMTDSNYVHEIYEPVYRSIFRADAYGQDPVQVGTGVAPFWLTPTTYGYSRLNGDEEMEMVLADSADDEANVWVETADLIPLIPTDRGWNQLGVWNVWVNPADPEMVVIMTTPGGNNNYGPYQFFSIGGMDSEPEVEWLFSHDFPASNGYSPFSPDGRYLLVPQRGTAIHFRDLETGETLSFDYDLGFFDGWTPDSKYYVQRNDDRLTLTNPESGLQIRLNYDFSTCLGIQWLED